MAMLCATKAVPGGADWSGMEQNVPEQQLVARKLEHIPQKCFSASLLCLQWKDFCPTYHGGSYALFDVFLFSQPSIHTAILSMGKVQKFILAGLD